jgi:hypothetical protein
VTLVGYDARCLRRGRDYESVLDAFLAKLTRTIMIHLCFELVEKHKIGVNISIMQS